MEVISADGADVLLRVKVVPGASRTRILGPHGDRLRIAVAAPPEKGKANIALAAFLATVCGLRARSVTVEAGHAAPTKTIRLHAISMTVVRQALDLTQGGPCSD
jgi:uncharacterized protein